MISLLLCAVLSADPDPRFEAFEKGMSGVEFTGTFTIDGVPGSPKQETYTIRKVEKLPQGDLWRITARIKYGDTDVELPMDLPVVWAGNTPVITLDQVWLPGLGTFSARVMVHDKKYAGTWRHDEHAGLMYGTIKPISPPTDGSAAPEKSDAEAKKNSGAGANTP